MMGRLHADILIDPHPVEQAESLGAIWDDGYAQMQSSCGTKVWVNHLSNNDLTAAQSLSMTCGHSRNDNKEG